MSLITPYLQSKPTITEKTVKLLLIDDQEIVGETVRRLIEPEKDIEYKFCNDPTEAIKIAQEFKPTIILQDLVMPQIDGLTLVRYFRANPSTKEIPMIVLSSKEEPDIKAKAFECGANDYLIKLPDKIEFLARVRYHSNAYQRLLERNAAFAKLAESQRQIQDDLDQAASYVISLLPQPLTQPVATSWAYIPSSTLGGDAFGYHWVDPDTFIVYLLDVCGHGVGSALLSITVMNFLRSTTMLQVDIKKPDAVLLALNQTFQQEDRFFTIWYGVYNKTTRTLEYASAGHPPALLFTPGEKIEQLSTPNFVVGGLENTSYSAQTRTMPKGSYLYIYSDGIFELDTPNGNILSFDDFLQYMNTSKEPPSVDAILKRAQSFTQKNSFDDDFSIVRVAFL